MSKYQFTDKEKEDIKLAVRELERVSSGELVPYFVPSSDKYEEAPWYSTAITGLFTLSALAFLSYSWMLPVQLTPIDISMVVIGLMLVAFLMPIIIPSTLRWLVSQNTMDQRVHQRAIEAFLEEGVHKTEDRIGILLFVSRLEHRVIVLGDEGINQKVDAAQWQGIADSIVKGIKNKEIGNGFVAAIQQCQELLVKHGFHAKSGDKNELTDDLRIGE